MDIPLDDPEANKAAAKIQAGFRGHMTRKKMKPDEKTGEEVSSSGEALNGSERDTGQCHLSLTRTGLFSHTNAMLPTTQIQQVWQHIKNTNKLELNFKTCI